SSASLPTRSQCSAWALMERLNAPLVRRRLSCVCSEILMIPIEVTWYMFCSRFVYYQDDRGLRPSSSPAERRAADAGVAALHDMAGYTQTRFSLQDGSV